MSWRRLEDVFETSWRHLEDVLKTLLQDVLKTIGKRLEKVFVRHLKDVLKMSSRCMAKTNILVLIKTSWRLLLKTYDLRRIYSSWSRRLRDVLKTSFEGENKRDLNKVFKVFIKTNICWVRIFNEKKQTLLMALHELTKPAFRLGNQFSKATSARCLLVWAVRKA